jgi:hypothetical protein
VGQKITLSAPNPMLDAGCYMAICTAATYAWASQWKKWIARLVLEPPNYTGSPYTGDLCAFLSLGSNRQRPHAGQHSRFRRLLVEVNGDQPTNAEVDMDIVVGRGFDILVDTAKKDRNGNDKPPEHWYSIVRELHLAGKYSFDESSSTFQPVNTSTIQHPNTVTQEHSNTPVGNSASHSTSKQKSLISRPNQNVQTNHLNGDREKSQSSHGEEAVRRMPAEMSDAELNARWQELERQKRVVLSDSKIL